MPFVGKNKGDLLSRTKRMIDNKNAGFNYRHQLLALLLMTGMLRSIAWLQPLTHKQFHAVNALETKKQKTFVQLPMLVDISNPFFNPMFFLQKPLRKEIAKAVENAKKEIITAENDDKIATKNLASSIVVTAKALEDIDWNEMVNDVEKNMKIADPTMNALPPIMLDTLCYKDIFKQQLAANMGEQKKGWQQLNLELKKIGAELEKAFKEKNLLKILEWQKHQSQINKAFTQLKNSKLPFLFNFSIPKINIYLNKNMLLQRKQIIIPFKGIFIPKHIKQRLNPIWEPTQKKLTNHIPVSLTPPMNCRMNFL